jgi:hypothetical protein
MHLHWWWYLIAACIAYFATFIFDQFKEAPMEEENHNAEDKYKGK